jgi:alkanesulfonate monooxygenase SsuD/methylene tetrahydromethanopterin reductase-like flavin-dependent oxidoreductase (luciferase family)
MSHADSNGTFLSFSLPVGYGVPPKELVRLIQHADQLGLPGVAVGELTSTDALALVAAAAPVTTAIRLETSVLSVLTRSPSLLAMSAATIADLSNNRFVLGLGAGSPIGAAFHGQPFVKTVERVERWITDVRAALDGRTLKDWGSFRLRGVEPVPVPILVAAMNPRMLKVAGEHGDGVILNLCGPEQVARLTGQALQARLEAGIGRPFEVHATLWADATGDPERAYEQFRIEMAPYLAVSTYRSAVIALSDEPSIDRAAAAWREGGRAAAAALFPDSIVTAMVATDAADLAAKAGAMRTAGCTGVRVTPLTHAAGIGAHAADVVDLLAEAQSLMR